VGVAYANKYDGTKTGMSGFSIPAAEHSTMTMWGREHEVDAYRNMIRQYGQEGKIFAVVSDSYDLYNAVENIWGKELKGEVLASGAVLVVRPDSGHPPTVVLKTLQLLEKQFGVSYNAKGYKVLNGVRVIQGDGINMESIRQILDAAKGDGFSAENVKFGMGGALLQKVDRDTQKFAFKCSHATVNGKSVDVFKEPVTDMGKRSKRGKLNLVYMGGEYKTVNDDDSIGTVLKTVFENGEIKKLYTLDEVRRNSTMNYAL
jgi:nicotinamide phosphoribosyltransferase